jgi:hypothetical protein
MMRQTKVRKALRKVRIPMNKWMKRLLTFGLAATLMFSTSIYVFAEDSQVEETAVLEEEFTGEEVQVEETAVAEEEPTETSENTEQEETAVEDTEVVDTESEAETTGDDAFSVEGNGTVLDHIVDEFGKEFYTIQTANNNTFFMVIDYSGTGKNVYMLSMIDENDLKDFLEEDQETETTVIQPAVILTDEATEKETTVDTEPVAEEPGDTSETTNPYAPMVILGLLGAAVVGGYYYLKIYRPKKYGAFSNDEDLEYMDEGETINEDESAEK